VDLLEGFKDIEDAKSLYAIPGDPHPNAAGHTIMADILVPALEDIIEGERRR
jgi:lysophospholipase L1-like esterase